MHKYICRSIEDLNFIAQKFCECIKDNRIFLFYGEMGSGKTTFIKEICKILNTDQEITSPTFAIVNEYTSKQIPLIYHFDFYRINHIREVFDIGFEEYIDSGALVFIEWPEMLEEYIPENSNPVNIILNDDLSREISW